jgi:hypothetical protein
VAPRCQLEADLQVLKAIDLCPHVVLPLLNGHHGDMPKDGDRKGANVAKRYVINTDPVWYRSPRQTMRLEALFGYARLPEDDF